MSGPSRVLLPPKIRTSQNRPGAEKAGSELLWSMKTPSEELYKDIKGISLSSHRSPGSFADSETSTRSPYKLSENLLSTLGWEMQDEERWNKVFGPRVAGILSSASGIPDQEENLPEVFPGVVIEELSLEKTQYKRFLKTLEIRRRASNSRWDTRHVSRLSSNLFWPWLYVERPYITALNPGLFYGWSPPEVKEAELDQSEKIRTLAMSKLSLEEVHSLLEMVHADWGKTLRARYDLKFLTLAREIIKKERDKIDPAQLHSLIFELEAFAHYASLVSSNEAVYTGFFQGLWVEIVRVPLQTIRATELCQTERLLDELLNLCEGRTAPVVINEYGSVADGNHRLTATWLWNLLSATRNCEWSLANEQFQKAVGEFVRLRRESMSPVTVHEILRHLALMLDNSRHKERLENHLKAKFRDNCIQYQIESLPAVYISTYNNVAAIAEIYDKEEKILRFEPGIYEALLSLKSKVLPERACYHFADRVPLPWFDLISFPETEITSDSLSNGAC